MKMMMLCLVTILALSFRELNAQDPTDHTLHAIESVTVEPGVQLEVLDWGGSGRPLIFLAGAGDTAHRFDGFAPQFTAQHHVYGITRRGFGASSKPAPANGNYSADHLGDDVVAVMKALHIDRPVLIGHSIAGEELSSVGSRFPEMVSGLIYLDAATDFALYDPAHPLFEIEMNDIRRRIDEIEAGGVDEKKMLLELETAVAKFETVLHQNNLGVANLPPLPPRLPINAAMNFGMQKYTSIPVPSLAIYACPHNWDRLPDDGAGRKAALIADDKVRCTAWADNFKRGVPSAHILMIPNADHYVYLSNEARVVTEINAFLVILHWVRHVSQPPNWSCEGRQCEGIFTPPEGQLLPTGQGTYARVGLALSVGTHASPRQALLDGILGEATMHQARSESGRRTLRPFSAATQARPALRLTGSSPSGSSGCKAPS